MISIYDLPLKNITHKGIFLGLNYDLRPILKLEQVVKKLLLMKEEGGLACAKLPIQFISSREHNL